MALRILRLELQKGCTDQAVNGGLEAFMRRWHRDLPESDQARELAARLVQLLEGYRGLPLSARRERVGAALVLVESAGRLQPGRPGERHLPQTPRRQAKAPQSLPPGRQAAVPGDGQPASAKTKQPATAEPLPPPDTPIIHVKGIGRVRAQLLARLGIVHLGDLLTHYPFRYEPYPPPRRARELFFQRIASFIGRLQQLQTTPTTRGGKRITATLCDETGCVEAVWFRAGHGTISAKPGDVLAVSGPIAQYGRRLQFQNPDWEHANGEPVHTRRLVPVYPLTKGLSDYWLRGLIKRTLDAWGQTVVEPLPAWIVREHRLLPRAVALRQIHFPDSEVELEQARQRLAFDEMLPIQLLVLQRRHHWRAPGGTPLISPPRVQAAFRASLPFHLTPAQERVLDEILQDLARPEPMTRLLQGEVGSGKTVVAAASLLAAVASGAQGAIMAPTEILAEQHYRNLQALYERAAPALVPILGRPIRLALLTGSTRAAERARLRHSVADGSIDLLIGTHALIQEDVEFARLCYVVIDEQHRFGVRQRVLLRQKGHHPHMLVMTATPIPRTLALTLYGDLDVSRIDELPAGRQPIRTRLLRPSERHLAYDQIRAEVRQGHQAFIICPLIDDSPALEVRAAVEEYERLQRDELAGLRLALLHGRMRPQEKEAIMRAFRDGGYDVLVSTAVVEVGVDIPNATVMVIEGAERFGLSQLHQFRGRVGRGPHASTCLLLTDQDDPDILKRLRLVEESTDGLALAERDLMLRGPGEFFGVRQSGFPDLRMARLTDTDLIERARAIAGQLIDRDPELAAPEHALLRQEVERLLARSREAE